MANKKGTYINCAHCGKEKRIIPAKKRERNFCNSTCHNNYMSSEAIRNGKRILMNCSNCDKEFSRVASQPKRKNPTCSTKCGGEMRTKLAEQRYEQGVRTEGQKRRFERVSKKAQVWRKKIFERDNYTCQMCGQHGGYLQADHIKPFAYFPELRYDLENGRTLCRPCHKETDTYGYKARKIYEGV